MPKWYADAQQTAWDNLPEAALALIPEDLAVESLMEAEGLVSVKGAAACEISCFVAGTPVQMADGTTRPIEQIQAGDWVLSRDQHAGPDGPVVASRVVRPMHHEHPNAHMVTVTVSSGDQFTCTDDHPFCVPNSGWVMAGQLSIGTQIVPRAGPTPRDTLMAKSVVTRVDRYPANALSAHAGRTTVCTVEVEGTHTYFVGATNGGTWVHNDCTYDLVLGTNKDFVLDNSWKSFMQEYRMAGGRQSGLAIPRRTSISILNDPAGFAQEAEGANRILFNTRNLGADTPTHVPPKTHSDSVS